MSNRLQIYNKTQGTYMTIAKDFSNGYILGNVDLLMELLSTSYEEDVIEIVKDWDGIDEGAKDINTTNKWEIAEYQKVSDEPMENN